MRLHVQGIEYYKLELVTIPAVSAWEATFDHGVTWISGVASGGLFQWLVAGPSAAPSGAVTIQHSTDPRVRATDAPETIIREAPRISIFT